MATRYFDTTLSAEVNYVGERWWKGDDINKLWNLFNYNSDNRASWALDANGWIQYRSTFGTYAGRYNPDDITLGDTYFETDIQPAGSGNYEVGFFMRFIDRYSFYYLSYNGGFKNWGTKNIRLYKVTGTVHQVVADAEVPVFNMQTVYKFRCELTGNNIKIIKDGVPIIDWSDPSPNPYTKGAFGPWVLGQEFAKWRGFEARNNSPFSLSKVIRNENVTNAAYDPASAKLLSSQTVGEFLTPDVEAYLAGVSAYESWSYRNFRLSSSDSRVLTIFDRTSGKNTTELPSSRMYAYQTLPTSAPLPASNLQAVAVNASSIRLTWSHADDSEDGFRIYDENDVLIATVGENVLTYTETNLNEGTLYYRKVRAYNVAGESTATSLVAISTLYVPPLAPTNFEGVAVSDKRIAWVWTPGSSNEESFELVTWDSSSNVVVAVTGIPKGTMSYVEESLIPSTRYVRAIRARNVAGVSDVSNPYEVFTREELPQPPSKAPANFYGLGVSDRSIFWFWLDTNTNEDGFELVDQNDVVVAVIGPNQQSYMETGLYSSNIYQRKLRAYNTGGSGPETSYATAKTLADGQNQIDKPVPPINLKVEVLGITEARFTWEYDEDSNFPAVGFKLYTSDGTMMAAVPVEDRETTLSLLMPNTSYRFYLTAYNDFGDSLKTNMVEFTTPHIIPPTPTPIDPGDLEDPYYGISYDQETLEMDKLKAFQSGIGDKLDLVVRNLQPRTPNLEVFGYEVYMTGEYDYEFEGQVTRMKWESGRVLGRDKEVLVGETVTFKDQLASPMYDVNWQDIDARFPIFNYKLIYTSTNPNVELLLEREITEFFPTESTFIELPFKARIINETQTAWYPSIHAGYYYLNQQEWFLYVDDKVRPRSGDKDEAYVLKFPYVIRAYGGRYYPAQEMRFIDTTKADFLQGEFDSNVDVERAAGSISIKGGASGEFISRMFRFGRPVSEWYAIEVDIDTDAPNAGGSVSIEVGESDYLGNVTDWYPQDNNKPIALPASVDKIRYRLNLNEGWRKEQRTLDYYLDNSKLSQGINQRTVIAGNSVLIGDMRNSADGVFISAPIDLGDHIDDLGIVTCQIDLPGDSVVQVFTATSDDPTHDFFSPTSDSPWIPSGTAVYSPTTNSYSFSIQSANKRYLAIILKLIRGTELSTEITLNASTFEQSRGRNLKVEDDKITLVDKREKGIYTSGAIYFGTVASFSPLKLSIETGEPDVIIETVTGGSQAEVENISQSSTAWRQVRNGIIQSTPNAWVMYRITINPIMINCQIVTHVKDSYADFANHSGRTNMNIVNDPVDAYITVINQNIAASYTSEDIDIGLSDRITRISIRADRYKNVTMTVMFKVNGAWTYGTEHAINDDGTFNLTGLNTPSGSTHLRYRINIPPYALETPMMLTQSRAIQYTPQYQGRIGVYEVPGLGAVYRFTTPLYNQVWEVYESNRIRSPRDEKMAILSWNQSHALAYGGVAGGSSTDERGKIIDSCDSYIEIAYLKENGTWSEWFRQPSVLPRVVNGTLPQGTGGTGTYYFPSDSGNEFKLRLSIKAGLQNNGSTPVVRIPYGSAFAQFKMTTTNPASKPARDIYQVDVSYRRCEPGDTILNYMGFGGTRYVAPVVSEIHVRPNLFNMIRVIPTVTEVRLGGYIKEGYVLETFAVPMIGELVTDGAEYPLTNNIVEDIVYEYLSERGTVFDDDFQFTDYQLQVDPIYPVILRTESSGLDRVYGRSTREAGELLYRDVKIYFGPVDHKTTLTPIPQNGSPIAIRNAAGQLLRHVHFRDSNGYPSLTYTESPMVEHQRYLFVQYNGIDPATLVVEIEVDGVYTKLEDVDVVDDRIILKKTFPSGTPSRVSYRLVNSFIIDYNASPETDACVLSVHTPYDPGNIESRRLDIKYEVKKETPYYLAKEIDLNPLRTVTNSGFMYLTDTVYPPFDVDIQLNPNVLYRDKPDRIVINAIVKDEFGNPVVGEKTDFSASVGSMQVISRTSDDNGMVTAVYTPPLNTTESKAIINVQVISRDVSKQVARSSEIFFVDSQATNKIAIISENHMVQLGDVVKLKVKVMGANDEPLEGRNVSLYADQGELSITLGTTNDQGELELEYLASPQAHRNIVVAMKETKDEEIAAVDFSVEFELVDRYLESDVDDGLVFIEAETYDDSFKSIREQILLGVNGV